jgi:hypothetical protein
MARFPDFAGIISQPCREFSTFSANIPPGGWQGVDHPNGKERLTQAEVKGIGL